MSNSRKRGAIGAGPESLRTGIVADRTPGSLGANDAADPDHLANQGDTPLSVGFQDGASPEPSPGAAAFQNVAVEEYPEIKSALELVESYISAAGRLRWNHARRLMRYWRQGGDDRQGAARPDHCWLNALGEPKQGLRISGDILTAVNLAALMAKLRSHRHNEDPTKPDFIKGARKRLFKKHDGALPGMKKPNKWNPSMVLVKASGNWPPSDLQFAMGPCSIVSRVRVKVTGVERDGEPVDHAAQDFVAEKGDKFRIAFTDWEVALADRYDWTHGESGGQAGEMLLMNMIYAVTHFEWKNPQEILQKLESAYGFGDPNAYRVYARPFDVETHPIALRGKPQTPYSQPVGLGAAKFAFDKLVAKDFVLTY